MEFGVWSLEFGVWSLEFGVWSLEILDFSFDSKSKIVKS
ncbi:Cytosine deaminase [Nostoc sphaeroides CCNUC1]|uniref:Cytosine deaminase n=1 Tax=Nostoc sphaeroides CCNUC1 TaxID=2653204 RepID=A0A5P8W908_9NOSO|nr:Cytosine deaminase [Nostoc sphaeroides CCNUC1]